MSTEHQYLCRYCSFLFALCLCTERHYTFSSLHLVVVCICNWSSCISTEHQYLFRYYVFLFALCLRSERHNAFSSLHLVATYIFATETYVYQWVISIYLSIMPSFRFMFGLWKAQRILTYLILVCINFAAKIRIEFFVSSFPGVKYLHFNVYWCDGSSEAAVFIFNSVRNGFKPHSFFHWSSLWIYFLRGEGGRGESINHSPFRLFYLPFIRQYLPLWTI